MSKNKCKAFNKSWSKNRIVKKQKLLKLKYSKIRRRKIWSSWQICLSKTKKMKSNISRKKLKITMLLPRNKPKSSQSKPPKSRKKKSSSLSKMLNKKLERHLFSTNLITLNQTLFKMLSRTSPEVAQVKQLPKQPKL